MLLMLGAMAVGGGDLTVVSVVLRLVESVTIGSAANACAENIAMKMTIFFSIIVPFYRLKVTKLLLRSVLNLLTEPSILFIIVEMANRENHEILY
jgi:hypothetical protein